MTRATVLPFSLLISLAFAILLTMACGPTGATDPSPEADSGTSISQPKSAPQTLQETLDSLAAVNTSVESFRVTETQVNAGVRGDTPWTKTNKMVQEYQAPDRARTVFFAVEYVRDTDGDGIFEEVTGGSSCETQEAVTIGATFYERCDAESWTLTERRSAYMMPVQVAGDLLVKVSELEGLRLLAPDMIDGRAMLVFEGRIPEIPPDVYEATRTVWIDEETALIRRVVETVNFEERSPDVPPEMTATADYTDYDAVIIELPDTS